MTGKDEGPQSITCYSRLDASVAQFRTITLLPGQRSDAVQCQLNVHSLDKPPQYQTISYAWGDPSDTKQIVVDGVELAVPSSLELCLKHLRSSGSALSDLWADAICIDQTNMQERAHQVSNMGAIYWRCSSMFIWLGPPRSSSESRNPFEMVLHWADNKHFHQYPGFSISEESGDWIFQDNSTYQQMYELFADFISRPWWTRLWCVQEIALCPSATLVLGEWRLPWATVLVALKNYYRHAADCCSRASGLFPAKYTYFSDHLLFLPQQSELVSADRVFRAFRHKLCKDPRDKIYGLLGLLWKEQKVKIRPDYSLPVSKVYLQAMEVIISQSEDDLRFLTGLGFGSDCYQSPSWIRNFAAPLHPVEASYEYSRYKRYHCYNASAEMKSNLKILHDTTLSLTGIFVDRIKRIGTPIQDRSWTHIWANIQEWAQIAELPTLDQDDLHEHLQDHFWRTIMADTLHEDYSKGTWARLPTPTDTPISSWFADTIDHLRRGLEPLITRPVNSVFTATYSRAFFRTEAGHLGLCFPDARVGDEVWVLAGGRVPFVLRRLDGPGGVNGEVNKGAQNFRLVGECYLHGFMDGEALHVHDTLVSVHLK